MQLQFSTAADCPPRYPFRFTTRNTLSRAHERRLPEPPKKQEETGSLFLLRSRVLTLARALSEAEFHYKPDERRALVRYR